MPDEVTASVTRRVRIAATAFAVLLICACGGDDPQAEQTPSSPATVTMTVTATETMRETASASGTPTSSATTSVPQPSATSQTSAPAPTRAAPTRTTTTSDPVPESSFDRDWADSKVSDIIEDIRIIDERLLDGIQVPTPMRMLGDSFVRLADAGVPPGVDAADYMARLATLEDFARQAADTYSVSPIEGAATFAVVREQTGVLFDQLNAALGTSYRLP